MCDEKVKCQKPKELKGKPGECPPEQIEKCHGTKTSHPCTGRKKAR